MGHSTLNKQAGSHIEAACRIILVQWCHDTRRNQLKARFQGMHWLKPEGHLSIYSDAFCSCQITKDLLRYCDVNPVLHILLRFQGLQCKVTHGKTMSSNTSWPCNDATTSSNLFQRSKGWSLISYQLISASRIFKVCQPIPLGDTSAGPLKMCSVPWAMKAMRTGAARWDRHWPRRYQGDRTRE